ncbi:DUF5667 domain-containing protein [Streptomyces rubellomurinus]|uniref:DUF5667 domain-containing protein n=2 Tax=Streptomyces TaxID=1883 RepID=A0A0F2TBB5_STRR3|nr:DUF5667 domain-containing protein [Streptomyces rubellomurinus]KJS55320.1 hypothetical protein VM98_13795 [Streptomyces rubellomurinus subsp. indigoferus]KJS60449.1 hypothetical protein VM95_21130 [Streptomyces rubellomurinus]
MTANVLEHRRAKAFAEALEAHQTEQRHADGTGSADTAATGAGSTAVAELVSVADALGALPGPELDREVRTVQRAQLMAAFEQAFAGGPGATVPRQRRHRAIRTAPRGRWSRRFAIGGLVAGLAVGSLAGAAAASSNALPGDTLYGMKRGLEGLRLDLADSDSERGQLLLDNAATRLGEARTLVGRTDPAGALSPGTVDRVRRALDDMHADALKGRELLRSVYRSNGSLDPMRALAGFAQDEDGSWTELEGKLPVQLTQQAHLVNQLFDDISEDVAPLRLAQPAAKSGAPAGTGAGGGQSGQATDSAPGDTPAGGTGTAPGADQPQGGSTGTGGAARPGDTDRSPAGSGLVLPGTGAKGGGLPSAVPSNGADAVNGLVGDLTGGLTAAKPSPSADAAPPQAPQAPGTPSAAGGAPQQGVDVPPLIPGLLPGLRILGGS